VSVQRRMSADGSLRDSCDDGGVTDNGSDKYSRPGLVHRRNESRFNGTDSPTVVLRAILNIVCPILPKRYNGIGPKKSCKSNPAGCLLVSRSHSNLNLDQIVVHSLCKSGSRREGQMVQPSES
jgi:hypothetical protein